MKFEEMMQKAVYVEAKAGLKSSNMVQNLDICCPRDYRLSNSIVSKVQTKRTTAKDFYLEEFKVKKVKPILFRTAEASESFK